VGHLALNLGPRSAVGNVGFRRRFTSEQDWPLETNAATIATEKSAVNASNELEIATRMVLLVHFATKNHTAIANTTIGFPSQRERPE